MLTLSLSLLSVYQTEGFCFWKCWSCKIYIFFMLKILSARVFFLVQFLSFSCTIVLETGLLFCVVCAHLKKFCLALEAGHFENEYRVSLSCEVFHRRCCVDLWRNEDHILLQGSDSLHVLLFSWLNLLRTISQAKGSLSYI